MKTISFTINGLAITKTVPSEANNEDVILFALRDLGNLIEVETIEDTPPADEFDKVKEYAILRHRRVNQWYGDEHYDYHLGLVDEAGEMFKHLLTPQEYRLAKKLFWTHDMIEDVHDVTYNDLKKDVGEDVADGSYALANNKGKTRAERADEDYYEGINAEMVYIYGKMSDRIANFKHSAKSGSGMFTKYRKEYQEFKQKLFIPRFQPIWDYIEATYPVL